MQLAIDTLANTSLPIGAATLEIPNPSSGTSLTLEFDNVFFPQGSTFDIYYTGGVPLTLVNNNGSNVNQDKCISVGGGPITVLTPATVTITGHVDGSDIYIIEHGTTDILAQSTNQIGDYSVSVQVNAIDVVVINLGYVVVRINNVDTTSDTTVPIAQRLDRTYNNP
jgi:hypothetical protein